MPKDEDLKYRVDRISEHYRKVAHKLTSEAQEGIAHGHEHKILGDPIRSHKLNRAQECLGRAALSKRFYRKAIENDLDAIQAASNRVDAILEPFRGFVSENGDMPDGRIGPVVTKLP